MLKLNTLVFFFFLISYNAYSKNTYFIEWNQNASQESVRSAKNLLDKKNISLKGNDWKIETNSSQLIKALKKTGAFNYIEKDKTSYIDIDSTGLKNTLSNSKAMSSWSPSWHLDRLNVKKAWNITIGTGVTVAVCDSGVKKDHPELRGRVLEGKDFLSKDSSDTTPNTNHGTAVAGFVAGSSNRSIGVDGLAPGVKILPGRIVNPKGGVPTSAMLACIRWAADQGAKIINVSMTGVNSNASHSAAKYAWNKGSLVFWAAGNQNWNTSWGDKKEIVAIGATDINNRRYYVRSGWFRRWGSNRGNFVDLAAPGEGVYYMKTDGSYGTGNGTSYASPMAAGVAALIASANPELSPEGILEVMKEGAKNIGTQSYFGAGLIDAEKSVHLALEQ